MESNNLLHHSSTLGEDAFQNFSTDVDWFGFENRIRQVGIFYRYLINNLVAV